MDRPVLRPSQLFGLFCLSALFVLTVLFGLIALVALLPSRHLFLIFALFIPLALFPYLRRRIPHRGRSQGTSSKGNLQGDQHDDKIPAYFIGYRHGFNTPESWAWGLPKQMGTPFTSSKDNLQGDQNDEEIPILMSRNDSYLEDFGRSVYFIGALLGFNTPKSWESWGPPEQMGAPFTSTKDNVQGDQNQIDFSEQNETNRITQPCSGLSEPSSSPDSCESSKMNRSPKSTKCALSSICGMHDENLVPGKKKHDLSSCDSNRTPSSEVEKGAGLNKKEVKGVNEQGEQGSSIVQEFRDTPGNIKSCSEGLKQCSQALEELLSRGELTQSLSPPHQDGNWAINSGNEKALGLQIDLNTKVSTTTCNISKTRAQSCSKMGSEVATFKRLFVDTEEKNNTGQEGRQ